jgi:hypothetical protein
MRALRNKCQLAIEEVVGGRSEAIPRSRKEKHGKEVADKMPADVVCLRGEWDGAVAD